MPDSGRTDGVVFAVGSINADSEVRVTEPYEMPRVTSGAGPERSRRR